MSTQPGQIQITVWRASSFEDAIAKAEDDGDEYAATLGLIRTDLVQAYRIADELEEGGEIFSLMRTSSLSVPGYLDHYFDDGSEHQKLISG